MLEEITTPVHSVYRRMTTYLTIALGLCFVFAVSRGSDWQGTSELHTLMEVVATTLALLVGIMALVRFYSKKNNTILFIGAGFLGTGTLDGYHAIVTSEVFTPYLLSDLPTLIPWSWVESRFLLSLLLFLSWLEWNWEHGGDKGRIVKDRHIYALVAVLTIASFTFFSITSLPRAFPLAHMIGRPEEFLPGILFLAALVGYLRKGTWKYDDFEHWLVLALVVSVIGQVLFMSFSSSLFDFDFEMAHLLKMVSYSLILTGLFFSMYRAFKEAEQGAAELALSAGALAQSNRILEKTAKDRQQAEILARQSEEKLLRIFENVPDGIILCDSRATILAFNPGAERAFGYRADEVIGRNIKILMPDSYARDHDTHVKRYRKGNGASAIGQRRELLGRRKDGTCFPMDLTISDSIEQSGGRMILGVMRDITRKKAAADDLARFVDELEKSNKDLEQFAYVASHDLRAPLRGIDNLAGFIREDVGDNLDDETSRNFDLLQNRIHRMERLLDDLLAYSRAGRRETSLETVDLQGLLQDVTALIAPPEGMDLQINCTEIRVRVARAPLQQVLMNLIGNAIKHHDQPTGIVRIDVRESGKAIKFSIADDGPGIPEQFHDRIFGMFQTLKPRDELEGSGMGLAIVRRVVESAGGSVAVYSTNDVRGTCFTVLWPKSPDGEIR